MKTFRFLFFPLLFILPSFRVSEALAQNAGKVRIVVSVDWEGRNLDDENLAAMLSFRQDYPEVPMQHFLNAAYFLKASTSPSSVTKAIQSVLLPADEHGLHVHAWRSLVQDSGVSFRTGPSFVFQDVDLASCVAEDCGSDVALTAYSETELRSIIRFSLDTLEKQGFKRAKSFRAGGWQADRKVLRALRAEGITLDSSATYVEFLKPSWGDANMYPFLKKLWPNTRPTSQPYTISLGNGQSILELPNNGCLADYMTADAMTQVFIDNAIKLQANPGKDVYVSIGFHQETAAEYLPRVRGAIDNIRELAKKYRIPAEFVVAPF